MFDDCRSKKVVLISHCLLNQNSISDGTADYKCCAREIVEILLDNHIGILQMPCPELMCLGLDRGDVLGSTRPVVLENTRIREQFSRPEISLKLQPLIDHLAHQVEQYKRHGFKVLGVIGANRSPSCGIDTTSKNNAEVPGKGVFIDALYNALAAERDSMFWIGFKTITAKESLDRLRRLLE